jgi:hypothetical protein
MGSGSGGQPKVVIAGAGIAGLTAALYLLEAGFAVTVLEKRDDLGGKFGAIKGKSGAVHEHAYHFLGDWCVNLWSVMAKIGLSRDEDCVASKGVQFLRPDRDGAPLAARLTKLSLEQLGERFTENVYGGVIPPDDMIIWFHSLLELMSHGRDLDEKEFLNRISVNGFMRSLWYMTDVAALLHQEALVKAFSIPSYETSARSYRRFARFFSRQRNGWILNQPVSQVFWPKFTEALKKQSGGVEWLQQGTTLTQIGVEQVEAKRYRVSDIGVCKNGVPENWQRGKDFDYLLVTVPFGDLVSIVDKSPGLLREKAPGLLELRKLRSKQMASLDLYFKRPLPGIPAEHVTLIDDTHFGKPGHARAARGTRDHERETGLRSHGNQIASRFGLSFVDNYQAWNGGKTKETWLNVVSADFEELAALSKEEAKKAIIGELRRYLAFDPEDDPDERTDLQLNTDLPLLMNTVGSWQYRPPAGVYTDHHTGKKFENLSLAGDYCQSAVDIVSLEGAVITARIAACQIADREIAEHHRSIKRVPREEVPAEISEWTLDLLKDDLAPWLHLATRGAFGSRTREARVQLPPLST